MPATWAAATCAWRSHAFAGIEKRPGVCGGDACVVRTRVPAWTLKRYRRLLSDWCRDALSAAAAAELADEPRPRSKGKP
jgi:uncharacterized protein (DUF433 family)